MQSLRMYMLVLLMGVCFAKAQTTPYLEKSVSLNYVNKTCKEIFAGITTQTGVVFSYSTFNDQQKLNYACSKKPLRLVLNEVLKSSGCSWKQKDKFIIINCDASAANKPQQSILNGYVYSAADSSKIAQASIYIKQNKSATLTNQYGFFKMTYPPGTASITLSCAKENFTDTSFSLGGSGKKEIVIFLRPKNAIKKDTLQRISFVQKKDSVKIAPVKKDSVTLQAKPVQKNNFWTRFKNPNFRNVTDTLFSDFQLSLVPYLSTNKLLSINTVNKVSLNLLVGYAKGVKYAEVGGILNIDNGDVRYAQVAGAGNIVSGNVSGAQIGGVFNSTQGKINGTQVGGVFNTAKDIKGAQIGGVFNVANENMLGAQIAGVFNTSGGNIKGAQIGGVFNSASKIHGAQIAGLINTADTVCGIQISGLINKTNVLKGVQIGFLNFSKNCKGTPIGFFSFVKNGYHKMELCVDENAFASVGFRSGIEAFHNNIFIGKNFGSLPDAYFAGYGVGTGFKIHKKLHAVFDFTAQQIYHSDVETLSYNMLNKIYAGLEFWPAKGLCIGAGPTFNLLVYDASSSEYVNRNQKFAPGVSYNALAQESSLSFWPGFKISLKFF